MDVLESIHRGRGNAVAVFEREECRMDLCSVVAVFRDNVGDNCMYILKIQFHDTNREVTALPRYPQASRRDTYYYTPGETASNRLNAVAA